ncbi:MAG: M50 family metallopeptidase, partial [candidate division NC10 bacterium]
MLLSLLAVLVTFGLVIFLHEAGHFIMCKRLGVRVIRFAFGFGPELLGVTSYGTRFSLCAIPLGGYVKPAGESIEDYTGHPDEYFSRSPWERLMIVAAGPAMNYVLAFLLFFAVVGVHGMPEPSTDPVIGEIAAGYPAAKAGLKDGDRILSVDRVEVKTWAELADIIHRSSNKKVAIEYRRAQLLSKTETTPQYEASLGHGLIGIKPKMIYVRVGFVRAAKEGAYQCWFWTAYTVQTLWQKIYRRERPDLAGPVGIVQMVSKAAHSGLEDLVFLIALISVAIGFFNLLPIPLLDGGHAVLYFWEGISRRKLTIKTMTVANSIGLVML